MKAFIGPVNSDGRKQIKIDEQKLLQFINEDSNNATSCEMDTVLRIILMFDAYGIFRFSSDELKGLLAKSSLNTSNKNCEPIGLQLAAHATSNEKSMTCSLCDLGTEHVIPRTAKSGQSAFQGLGCNSLSSFCSSKDHSEPHVHGTFGVAKQSLISISRRIPNALRATLEKSCFSPIMNSKSIPLLWDSDNLRLWTDHVLSANNLGMLVQTFIALVISIDRKKLPTWWNDDFRGWSNSSTISGVKTLPELLLHIAVLDLAVVEYSIVLADS
jgi:hypothetical protein